MILRSTISLIILSVYQYGFCQVKDDFSDGDFTNGPTWVGDLSEFQLSTGKLNSSGPSASAELFLSTTSQVANNTTWQFFVEIQGSAPSGSNKVRIFLMSDMEDLEGPVNGYYLEIGQIGDDFLNLKKSVNGVGTTILTGTEVFDTHVRVKVNRSASGQWIVMADHSGGSTFLEEGSTTDNTFQGTGHFGVAVNHTSSRSDDYFFDDFQISKPLEIDSVVVNSATEISVDFDQFVQKATAEDLTNYLITDSFSEDLDILDIVRDHADHSRVVLTLSALASGSFTLNVDQVLDSINALPISSENVDFSYLNLQLESLLTVSATQIQLTFNDQLDEISAENMANYSIDQGIGQPVFAEVDPADKRVVTLTLNSALSEGVMFQLSLSNMENAMGNSSLSTTSDFQFVIPLVLDTVYAVSKNEVLIRFNKPVNEEQAVTLQNYIIMPGIGHPAKAHPEGASSVLLTLPDELGSGTYTVAVMNVTDTDGNVIDASGGVGGFGYRTLQIEQVLQLSETSLGVKFNQPLEETSASSVINYELSESGNPVEAIYEAADSTIILRFLNYTTPGINSL